MISDIAPVRTSTSMRDVDLPSPEDIDHAVAGEWDTNKLNRLLAAVAARRPVWWRRDRFHEKPYNEVAPKWHVLRRRMRDPELAWNWTWIALCGYQRSISEILSGLPAFKMTPPRKLERCAKCDTALREVKKAGHHG